MFDQKNKKFINTRLSLNLMMWNKIQTEKNIVCRQKCKQCCQKFVPGKKILMEICFLFKKKERKMVFIHRRLFTPKMVMEIQPKPEKPG